MQKIQNDQNNSDFKIYHKLCNYTVFKNDIKIDK